MTAEAPNILLMRLKSMGDVVFTLPAVHLLRESFPRSRITFPVSAGVPLLVSAGLAKLSALTLAGDTGLLHLAAAMGGRVAVIIPSTAPGNK